MELYFSCFYTKPKRPASPTNGRATLMVWNSVATASSHLLNYLTPRYLTRPLHGSPGLRDVLVQ